MSGSLLSKKGFKLVFVSDNFILTKNEMYVGKGYMSNELFKMNVMTIVVTPKTIFLNDFFSWNLSFRCFMVHHEFIIIFRNYFSIKWNFRKIYPVRSNSEQL